MGWVYYLIVPSLKLIQTVNRGDVEGGSMDFLDEITKSINYFNDRDECYYNIENTKLTELALELTLGTTGFLMETHQHAKIFEFLSTNHCLAIWLEANNIAYEIKVEHDVDLVDYEHYTQVD